MQRLLNLGCGSRYRVDLGWTNVDVNSVPGGVIAHDLKLGIPFPDYTFDVVYHSHILEHFPRQDAVRLMRECFRVLKPGGFCRVVTPDMEGICRQYLAALDGVSRGDAHATGRYRWMQIELLDQLVRHHSGGEMATYLQQMNVPERDFVVGRIGSLARPQMHDENNAFLPLASCRSWSGRGWRFAVLKLSALRRAAISLFLTSHEMRALDVGLFRLQGESHLWMYDHYSLSEVLRESGFDNIEKCMAVSSRIPDWEHYYLDTERDGSTYKPDSLYMEGMRP